MFNLYGDDNPWIGRIADKTLDRAEQQAPRHAAVASRFVTPNGANRREIAARRPVRGRFVKPMSGPTWRATRPGGWRCRLALDMLEWAHRLHLGVAHALRRARSSSSSPVTEQERTQLNAETSSSRSAQTIAAIIVT